MQCLIIEDKILELLKEVKAQITTGMVCENCPNKCNQDGRCAMSMANLMVDIQIFEQSYMKHH